MGCKDNKKCTKIGDRLFTILVIVAVVSMSMSFYSWNLFDNTIIEMKNKMSNNVENLSLADVQEGADRESR